LVIKTSQLLLYREIIAVCSEIHTKHINTLDRHLIETTDLVSGETSVTVCIAVRGIERGKSDTGTERERE
jgi:hypothetical protein